MRWGLSSQPASVRGILLLVCILVSFFFFSFCSRGRLRSRAQCCTYALFIFLFYLIFALDFFFRVRTLYCYHNAGYCKVGKLLSMPCLDTSSLTWMLLAFSRISKDFCTTVDENEGRELFYIHNTTEVR